MILAAALVAAALVAAADACHEDVWTVFEDGAEADAFGPLQELRGVTHTGISATMRLTGYRWMHGWRSCFLSLMRW